MALRPVVFNSNTRIEFNSGTAGTSLIYLYGEVFPPTVTTDSITNVTYSYATANGTVTSQGTTTVTARGFVWNRTGNPSLTNYEGKSTDGSGTGVFSTLMGSLTTSQHYYVRAYATNSIGTSYGSILDFYTASQYNFTSLGQYLTCPLSIPYTNATYITIGGNGFNFGTLYSGSSWKTVVITGFNPDYDADGNARFTLRDNTTQITSFPYSINVNGLSPGSQTTINAYYSEDNAQLCTIGTQQSCQVSYYIIDNNNVSGAQGGTIESLIPQYLPTVTTASITNITETSASGGGNVTSQGSATVTARGIQWSLYSNFSTIAGTTTDGSGTGSFTSSLTNLTINTTYYVRAYATSSVGTAYGNTVSFSTLAALSCSGTASYSGGQNYPYTRTVTLGTNTGYVKFDYDAQSVPDRYIVKWNNTVVIDTGYRGSSLYDFGGGARSSLTGALVGKTDPITLNTYPDFSTYPDDGYPRIVGSGVGSTSFTKSASNPTDSYVYVYGPIAGTAWSFSMACPVSIPTVTTTVATNVLFTGATSGGNVTSAGGGTVSARGVCWSTSSNPTISNTHTTDGSGTGIFTSSLTGLSNNTTYYYRAYATNEAGTGYGAEYSFTTYDCVALTGFIVKDTTSSASWCSNQVKVAYLLRGTSSDIYTTALLFKGSDCTTYGDAGYYGIYGNPNWRYWNGTSFTSSGTCSCAPSVTTNSVTEVGSTTATCGGYATSNGCNITARGVCWNTSGTPTISDPHTNDGVGDGAYTSYISGLTVSVTYYVRAYVTNVFGVTSYGSQQSFTTGAGGYYDCGYGCQYYSYDPGCPSCYPGAITLTINNWNNDSSNNWIISDVQVNGTSLSNQSGFPVSKGSYGFGDIVNYDASGNVITVYFSSYATVTSSISFADSCSVAKCNNISSQYSTTFTDVCIGSDLTLSLTFGGSCI